MNSVFQFSALVVIVASLCDEASKYQKRFFFALLAHLLIYSLTHVATLEHLQNTHTCWTLLDLGIEM